MVETIHWHVSARDSEVHGKEFALSPKLRWLDWK